MLQTFIQLVESLNLTYPVKEIAARTGYTKGNVSIFLSNKKEPTKAFLKKFNEVFYVRQNDKKLPDKAIINEGLPEILGDHEVRLIRLESFMEVAVPTMAELNSVSAISGVVANEQGVLNEIASLKEQMQEIASKHFSKLQGKLFSFFLFYFYNRLY